MEEKDIEFESQLWKAADKLRKKVEIHEYKSVVFGLIFLRYLSFSFEERKAELEKAISDPKSEEYISSKEFRKRALEDESYYMEKGNLVVPERARWEFIAKNATQPNIGEIIDKAIEILEETYPKQLKGVIPKNYTKVNLNALDLAQLINIFSTINFGKEHRSKDIFGRIYEYFLGKFAEKEPAKTEQYTPRSLTNLIVDILDIKEGMVFDPACGSGGFFVSALEKMERYGLDKNTLTIYGQDSKEVPWRICKMNLALRGAEGDIRVGDSYHDDKFPSLRANYVVSNPPFNDSGWGAENVKYNDPRFRYGIPPDNNGNFTWIQHYIYHLAPRGKSGFVMANGALSGGGIEREIRKKIIEDDLFYGIVACPPKLFYNVSLPVSLWFLRAARSKPNHMKRKVLFIYAKRMFKPISRKQVVFTPDQLTKIIEKFKMFEQGESEKKINEAAFSKIAPIEEIAKNGYVLTPGRYVGIRMENEDTAGFADKMKEYSEKMSKLLDEEEKISKMVKHIFKALNSGL